MRQEAELQVAEVSKRQMRVREAVSHDNIAKLHAAESKMQEHKSNMAVLGKEAAVALAAVVAQQQRFTFQRLVAMICGKLRQKKLTMKEWQPSSIKFKLRCSLRNSREILHHLQLHHLLSAQKMLCIFLLSLPMHLMVKLKRS